MIAGLPYDAEVEYIESTGGQFLDLCVYGKINSVAKIRACATAHDGLHPLFGARTSFNSNGFSIYNGSDVGYKYTVSFDNVFSSKSDVVSDVSSDVSDWVDFTLGLHTKIGTWEKDYTSRAQTFTTRNYLLLFAWNSAGSIQRGKYRVSEFRLYEGGVLIQDFTPVRFTNSNGQSEGAMYDRVSRKLFRNAGTGSFTIGPDVATPVMGLHFFKSQIKTAKDYVQNGLIAMWDGIENAGWGVHDTAAAVWKNLNESGPTLVRRSSPIAWLDDALTITSADGNLGAFSVSSSSFASSVKTLEVVASFSATNNVQCIFNIGTGGSAGVGISTTGFMGAAGKTPFTSAGNDKPQSGSWLFSGGMDSSPVECFRNGISSGTGSTANISVVSNYITNTFVIGSTYQASYRFVGKIHSIRLYFRALTAEEIAANYAIDKVRFNLT